MIRLRALRRSDLEKTLSWNNSKAISELYLGHPFPVNKEMEELWYDKILTSNFPTSVFGIEHVEDKTLIGLSMLKKINLINRSSELAFYIGDDNYKGKGYSKIASNQTLHFGFYELNLNRIYLSVLENNSVAINLYEKLGFKQEAVLRESVFKKNQYINERIYSLLKKEFVNEL
jgi:RimJ/RimL family protein N-acetyltransferase